MRLSLPQLDGRFETDGLSAPVEVIRDANGVPHIYGETDVDVFFGLGVAHAQDRLWQMEFTRRVAQGRLSEILGNSTVSLDEFFRTLNFERYAEASLSKLPPTSRKLFDAYAAGINSIIQSTSWSWPPEFVLLFHRPEPWAAADSLLVTKMVSMGLSTNMFQEMRRAHLMDQLTLDQILQFFPAYPDDDPITLSRFDAPNRGKVASSAPIEFPYETAKGASNNWVVDGTRTTSGKPLLANDPHLELSAPSIWYLAHLALPSGNVIGGTVAGIPAVIVGRNDRIAWGFTNTGADTQDLYVERLNPDNPSEYQTPTGFVPFDIREETMRVRFGADKIIRVRETRHGPVLPETWGGSNRIYPPESYALALQWTALDEDDLTAQAGLTVMTAQNWDEFIEAAKSFHQPMQNILYADIDGNIGFIAPARVPIRKPENEFRGLLPIPGWDETYDWADFVPFNELPQLLNPERHLIVTANNRIVPPDYPYLLTAQWEPGLRARRIESELIAGIPHDVASFQKLQADEVSQLALDLLPTLVTARPQSAAGRQAFDLLLGWDGTMAANDARPLIFVGWYKELAKQIYADELGPLFRSHWSFKPQFLQHVLRKVGGREAWCDDVSTEPIEICEHLLGISLDAAMHDLQGTYGSDIKTWTWGDAHLAIHAHSPFENFPILNDIFNIEIPTGGGFYTVNRGGHWFSSSRPFANIHGSGYRAIYEFSDLDQSLYIQATGQSGNLFSEFYDNLTDHWARVDYLTMSTERSVIEREATARLTLIPAQQSDTASN
jgi:penicillin amidase